MKIFVTGATGLIGAHTALAFHRAGHDVRLLVRNRDVAASWFEKQGETVPEIIVGDMMDKELVKSSIEGCNAVFHAAAIVDLDARNAEKTMQTNLTGMENVIGSACELGIKRIIYVSSLSVLFDINQPVLNEQTPLTEATDAYSRSKTVCEEKVRKLQAEGYPIITTYPSGVYGPNDPKMSESTGAFLKFIKLIVPLTSTGVQFVDVRDIAIAHTLLLEKPLEDDRSKEIYLVTGHFMPWRDFATALEKGVGRKLRKLIIPGSVFRFLGAFLDVLRKVIPISFPMSHEAAMFVTQSPPADASKLLETLDMEFRDPVETFRDTANWMREEGLYKG